MGRDIESVPALQEGGANLKTWKVGTKLSSILSDWKTGNAKLHERVGRVLSERIGGRKKSDRTGDPCASGVLAIFTVEVKSPLLDGWGSRSWERLEEWALL